MADAGFILEIIRLVLYGLEFISSILVFSITADKLYYTSISGASVCLLNASAKPWNCACIIAFAVLAWLTLTAVIIWHCLKYINKGTLPPFVEGCIFAGLTVTWFIIAMLGIRSPSIRFGIYFTYSSPGKDKSEVIAARLFSWVNFIMHAASTVVAFLSHFSGSAAATKPQPVVGSISTAAYGSQARKSQPGNSAGSPVPHEGQAYQPVDARSRTAAYVAEGQIPQPPAEGKAALSVDVSNRTDASVAQRQAPQPATARKINSAQPEQGQVAQV